MASASGLPPGFSGPQGFVVGVDDTDQAKEPFQASIIQLGGTVHGSKGRGYLNYLTLGGGTPGQAWNMARVQERANVPVWVGWFKDEPVIMALDKSRMEPNGARGYRSPLLAQHAPDHGWGSGDPDYVDDRRLKPLMVRPAGEFKVHINPGRYGTPTGRHYFPGQQNYDLSDHQPAVAGTKRRVGLYLDSSNAVQEVVGGLFAVTAVLPELIWPAGAFPLISFILFESKDFIDFEYVKQEKVLWTLPADGKVLVSATDTTPGYLEDKILPLTHFEFGIAFPGGNEQFFFDLDQTTISHAELDNLTTGDPHTQYVLRTNLFNENKLYHSLSHDIWLEGTTFNDVADDTYVATLWNALHNGQAPDVTGQVGGSTDPFARCLRCTFDSASSQAGFVQFYKNKDTVELRGKAVSISADLWGTNVSNLRMAVAVWTGTGDALTSDMVGTWSTGNPTLATSWAFIGTPADIAITGTRTRYAVENLTIPTNANNIGLFIWTPEEEGSGDLFNIARVKLEEGTVATDFSARDYAVELFLVEHFARILDASSNLAPTGLGTKVNTTAVRVVVQFATMRATPALSHNVTAYTAGNPATTAVALVNMITNSFYTITGALTLLAFTANKNMVLLNFVAGTSWDGAVGDLSNARLGPDVVIMLSARL